MFLKAALRRTFWHANVIIRRIFTWMGFFLYVARLILNGDHQKNYSKYFAVVYMYAILLRYHMHGLKKY